MTHEVFLLRLPPRKGDGLLRVMSFSTVDGEAFVPELEAPLLPGAAAIAGGFQFPDIAGQVAVVKLERGKAVKLRLKTKDWSWSFAWLVEPKAVQLDRDSFAVEIEHVRTIEPIPTPDEKEEHAQG